MQNGDQAIWPDPIITDAMNGYPQHLLDLATFEAQHVDVIGELVCHLRRQTLLLDHCVQRGYPRTAGSQWRYPHGGDLRVRSGPDRLG